MAGELKVTLKRSTIGALPKHRRTVQALGLRKINSQAVHKDNAAVRGMLFQVKHLVEVQEL